MERAQAGSKSGRLTPWRLACLAGLASLWGLMEVAIDETLILVAAGLLLLATARVILDLPGSSTAIAGIAALFRWVNAAPFYCHLAGIAFLGVAFDMMASTLLHGGRRSLLRAALAGGGSAYVSAFLFAGSMAWVFHYRYWPDAGKVTEHVLGSGTRTALAGLVAVPIGLWLGRRLGTVALRHPRPLLAATAGAAVLLWIVPWIVPVAT